MKRNHTVRATGGERWSLDGNDLESLLLGRATDIQCIPDRNSVRCLADRHGHTFEACPAYQMVAALSPRLRELADAAMHELSASAADDPIAYCPLIIYNIRNVLPGSYMVKQEG